MEFNERESQDGLYDVYYEDGVRYIVIEGLDPEQQIEYYPMQEALMPYVDTLMVGYWLLVLVVSVYLVGMYIAMPLYFKRKRR